MRGRTARGLLRLARRHGRASADGGHLQLTISQEELGKFLGMSRANVNRQLGQLKIADVIRIHGTEISIIDEKRVGRYRRLPGAEGLACLAAVEARGAMLPPAPHPYQSRTRNAAVTAVPISPAVDNQH
ncbi:MAG: Crp/Fnr family transcriptional regulator [Sphingomonadales bacterium]|nr:Crp/Fnr family transcriptional regulator [Sphingomonadales bacterium]